MMSVHNRFSISTLFALIIMFAFSHSSARELVPTPAGGGGPDRFANTVDAGPEVQNSQDLNLLMARQDRMEQSFRDFLLQQNSDADKSEGHSNIGGYDKLVVDVSRMGKSDIAVASNGDIFLAIEVTSANYGTGIKIYRSNDSGESFFQWASMSTAVANEHLLDPCLVVAEGNDDRLFIAYTEVTEGQDGRILLGYDDLSDAYGSMGPGVVIMEEEGIDFSNADLATDALSFSSYFLYVVAGAHEGYKSEIYYARSTNRGSSFEDHYKIGAMNSPNRGYYYPKVCYGFGRYVHVAMNFYVDDDNGDDKITMRRCPDDGGGGIYNWDEYRAVTPLQNDIYETGVEMVASHLDPELVVGYQKWELSPDGESFSSLGMGSSFSGTSGQTWEAEVIPPAAFTTPLDMLYQPITDMFLLCGLVGTQAAFVRMDRSEPTEWFQPEIFADELSRGGSIPLFGFAMDPSQSNQVCTAWGNIFAESDPDEYYFDAQWRDAPGYPNLAPGFPVALPHEPQSDPLIVDLDGDGDLEILFTDMGHLIQAYHHDGSQVAGWPIGTGSYLNNAAIAVGDLNGNGEMTVVAGTTNGEVHAFDKNGYTLDGFPVEVTPGSPVYVSIGAIGGPSPRTIVCAGNDQISFLDYQGQEPIGSHTFDIGGDDIVFPACIGDVDGDGQAEVVVALANKMVCVELDGFDFKWVHFLTQDISGAPTMADLDLDGDVEVIAPVSTGVLEVLGDGAYPFEGFPIQSPTYSPLSSVAVVQLGGSLVPELVVSSYYEQVEVYGADGDPWPGDFPLFTSPGWSLLSSPIIGNMDSEPNSDIIIGDEINIRAWSNSGMEKTGWPRELGEPIRLAGAIGDLDQDGYNEVVFLSTSSLFLVDVHAAVQRSGSWPMYGNNPQRTGCFDCVENFLSPVDPESEGMFGTQISFAPPSPNPSNGPTLFNFDLPQRAAVSLDVFDLRGHKIRSVFREELPAGSHAIHWDGRDGQGHQLASGVYFAKLNVRGPGVHMDLNRKINLLR